MEQKTAGRVISRRVLSRKVLGSSHPIAKKFRALKQSFSGVCIAPVLIIVAFSLLFYSEKFQKSSGIVKDLQLEKAEEISASADGLHKITGIPVQTSDISLPDIGWASNDRLYYDYTLQEYKEVEETETKTVTKVENGKEIEEELEETKLVQKWVDKESETKWAEFKLGEIEIKPDSAKHEINFTQIEYLQRSNEDIYVDTTSKTITPQLGDSQIIIRYLPKDITLIVVGEITNQNIHGGSPFIISNYSDSELVQSLETSESIAYWVMKGASWLLLTGGIMMILSPILSLIDFIPIAGKAASCVSSLAAAVISFAVIALGTIIIKFWWLCLALVLVGIIVLVILLITLAAKKNKKDEAVKEK